ncbi:hypothetical protein E4U54_007839 [Claviceps lovelessii]|nr:hypothetical protein E4U54_007839 [Claviceps lovelessii]
MIGILACASLFSPVGLVSDNSLPLLPLQHQRPTVTIKNGTYQGVFSPGYQQDFFLGMPYAKPPQRFTPPQSLDETWNTTRLAESYSPHCPGYGRDSIAYTMSEDCLHLNLVRPHRVARDAELPVVVLFPGGGLVEAGSADPRFNLSFIVEHSVRMKKPIIAVSLNYRLSAWGFLGSKEARDAGATNIGFRDQRLALRWLNENIAAFGGSPDKVTIWGESSGAESVYAQVVAFDGQHDGLFRAAIGQSGFGSILPRLPGGFNTTAQQQAIFDHLVRSIPSCALLVNTPAALDCLRSADFQQLNASIAQTFQQSWVPVLDGTILPDFSANMMSQGKFARVPLLVGTNSDEGAGMGPFAGAVDSDDDFRRAIQRFISPTAAENLHKPITAILDEALYLYPDIQHLGIPSLTTWPHVVRAGDEYAKQGGQQLRRRNAFMGDLLFETPRRRANLAWSRYRVPSFAYRFDVTPNGIPATLGATHFQEVAFVFHNTLGQGYPINPFGGQDTQYTARALALSKTMCAHWINFIVDLDPNGHNHDAEPVWPVFAAQDEGGAGRGLVFALEGPRVAWDDWRTEGINWFMENDLGLVGS